MTLNDSESSEEFSLSDELLPEELTKVWDVSNEQNWLKDRKSRDSDSLVDLDDFLNSVSLSHSSEDSYVSAKDESSVTSITEYKQARRFTYVVPSPVAPFHISLLSEHTLLENVTPPTPYYRNITFTRTPSPDSSSRESNRSSENIIQEQSNPSPAIDGFPPNMNESYVLISEIPTSEDFLCPVDHSSPLTIVKAPLKYGCDEELQEDTVMTAEPNFTYQEELLLSKDFGNLEISRIDEVLSSTTTLVDEHDHEVDGNRTTFIFDNSGCDEILVDQNKSHLWSNSVARTADLNVCDDLTITPFKGDPGHKSRCALIQRFCVSFDEEERELIARCSTGHTREMAEYQDQYSENRQTHQNSQQEVGVLNYGKQLNAAQSLPCIPNAAQSLCTTVDGIIVDNPLEVNSSIRPKTRVLSPPGFFSKKSYQRGDKISLPLEPRVSGFHNKPPYSSSLANLAMVRNPSRNTSSRIPMPTRKN